MRYSPRRRKWKKYYPAGVVPKRALKARNFGVFQSGDLAGFPNKVLFMPIEGVLMTMEGYELDYRKDSLEIPRFSAPMVRNLNRILSETGCCVVLTSEMCVEDIDMMQFFFNQYGVKMYERIIGEVLQTKYYFLGDAIIDVATGSKIKVWMDAYTEKHPGRVDGNMVFSYAILDYRTDILFNQRFYYVYVNEELGLTEGNAEEAIRLLNQS